MRSEVQVFIDFLQMAQIYGIGCPIGCQVIWNNLIMGWMPWSVWNSFSNWIPDQCSTWFGSSLLAKFIKIFDIGIFFFVFFVSSWFNKCFFHDNSQEDKSCGALWMNSLDLCSIGKLFFLFRQFYEVFSSKKSKFLSKHLMEDA